MNIRDEIFVRNYLNDLWFYFRYDIIKSYYFKKGDDKIFIGNKENRICRYCGESQKNKFKKEAHAFPELIGNHYLIDYEECDDCNVKFAINIEDHFGKWTAPWRTMERIDGKNGIPAYKSNDKETEVRAVNTKNINIFTRDVDKLIMNDENGRSMKMNFDRQPYIPCAVYKCLVKMAFVMLPDEPSWEKNALRIYLTDWNNDFQLFKPINILHSFAPGPLPNDRFFAFLLKAKNDIVGGIPHMQFILQMGNHSFQIILWPAANTPPKSETTYSVKNRRFRFINVSPAHEAKYGIISDKVLDMTTNTQVKGERLDLRFNFGEIKEVTELKGMLISDLKNTPFIPNSQIIS